MEDQEESDHQGAQGEHPPAAPPIPKDHAPGSQAGDPQGTPQPSPASDKIDRDLVLWTRALAIFTGALVIAAGLQFWAIRGQLNVMQGQLDIMAADQRPWISIENLSIDGPLIYDDVGWPSGKRWHIKLTYTLKNHGKTPATHVIFWAHILPIAGHYQNDSGWHGTFIKDELNAACDWPEKSTALGMDAGQLMFPGDEWPQKTFEVQGDEKDLIIARDGKAQYNGVFLIPVCVTYRSVYNNIRGVAAIMSGRHFDDAKRAIFGNDQYRTAEGYRIGKKSRATIDLNGEEVDQSDLVLGEPEFQAIEIK